jgi:hypothetical protein
VSTEAERIMWQRKRHTRGEGRAIANFSAGKATPIEGEVTARPGFTVAVGLQQQWLIGVETGRRVKRDSFANPYISVATINCRNQWRADDRDIKCC